MPVIHALIVSHFFVSPLDAACAVGGGPGPHATALRAVPMRATFFRVLRFAIQRCTTRRRGNKLVAGAFTQCFCDVEYAANVRFVVALADAGGSSAAGRSEATAGATDGDALVCAAILRMLVCCLHRF